MERLPVPRIVPGDVELLERRARDLAAGVAGDGGTTAGLLRLVAFRLRGSPCAVEASVVERAIALGAPFAIPAAEGVERAVAFVDERPIPVADLAGWASGELRLAARMAGAPALVVATGAGSVAVAVEGPLDLSEDRLAEVAPSVPDAEGIRVAGRLAGGAALLDSAWLAAWAERATRP